jgi:fructuronate reductase
MAYAGTIRGHNTVEQAISDPVVRGWVDEWWDDAARHLPLPVGEIAAYRAALLERYANPRIRHLLAQIAADGSQKLPIRILPTLRADLAQGRVPQGAVRVLAAWVCHLRGRGAPVSDVAADEFVALAAGDLDDAVGRVLERLGVDDPRVRASAAELARELER